MGIFSALTSWLAGRFTKSRASRLMASLSAPGYGSSYAGNTWTDSRTEQVKHYKYWTFIAISSIANKVAQLQPNAAVVRPAMLDQRLKRYRYKGVTLRGRRKAMTQITQSEDLEPLPCDHRLVRLLSNPNEPDTASDFWKELVIFLYLTGNAYIWLPPDSLGLPAEAWILPSHWVWPRANKSDGVITDYDIRPVYATARMETLPAKEIVHLKFKSPISKIDGWAHTTAGSRWIDQDEAISQSRWHAFANVAQLGPMLLLDEKTIDPTREDIERIEQRFMSRFSGPTKAGRPVILAGVKDIKPYMTSPREMDFSASSDQMRDMILGLFGVPRQAAMFSEGMTYGSNLAVLQWFCSFTINPLTKMIGDTYTEKIASRYDEQRRIRVYWDDCTPEDPVQKLAEHEKYLATGVLTINEVRQEIGYAPYEYGGDNPMLPIGIQEYPLNEPEQFPELSAVGAAADEAERADTAAQALREGQPPAGANGDELPDGSAGRLSASFANGQVKRREDW
jgi:HK97 family phage portal protein